jgi:hypothetical protein
MILKIYPADNPSKNEVYPLPQIHTSSFVDSSKPMDKFDSLYISSATDLKDTSEKCGAVLGLNNNYKAYSNIPWLGVRERCESFSK